MSAAAPGSGAAVPVRTAGILARPDLRQAAGVLHELAAFLRERRVAVCVERGTAALVDAAWPGGVSVLGDTEMAASVDLLVVLGGDGTLLAASHLLERPVPVLAVNFGSLGFLTEVALPELYPTLDSVLRGECRYEDRRMLHAVARRGGSELAQDDVLNDVVVTKTARSRLLELDVSIDGRFVSSFRSDGLIVSSPTGSTAYNLSAGGPIVHPLLPALVLTPICPHMLAHRPLAVPDESLVEVRVLPAPELEAHVAFDGQRGLALEPGDTLAVTRSTRVLRLLKAPARDYFEVLRTKLKWGEPTARRS